MKFSTLGVAAAVFGLALSQTTTLPTCAQPCVNQFTTGTTVAGCKSLDIACICSNKSFLSDIACCLATSCSPADQAQAVVYAKSLCSTAGVAVPDAVVCNTPSSGATGATVASSSASSTSMMATTSASAATGSAAPATMTSASASSSSASAAAAASSSRAAAFQNVPAVGVSFAGGLFAALALL